MAGFSIIVKNNFLTCTELCRSKYRHADPFGYAQGGLRGGITQAWKCGSYFDTVT